MKQSLLIITFLYLLASVLLWFIRVIPAAHNKESADCVVRYMDYVFPITRLHCPVDPKQESGE